MSLGITYLYKTVVSYTHTELQKIIFSRIDAPPLRQTKSSLAVWRSHKHESKIHNIVLVTNFRLYNIFVTDIWGHSYGGIGTVTDWKIDSLIIRDAGVLAWCCKNWHSKYIYFDSDKTAFTWCCHMSSLWKHVFLCFLGLWLTNRGFDCGFGRNNFGKVIPPINVVCIMISLHWFPFSIHAYPENWKTLEDFRSGNNTMKNQIFPKQVQLIRYFQLVNAFRSRTNCWPCNGFVITLTYILSVGRCFTIATLPSTNSLTQKCRMSIWRERSDAAPPRFTRAMQDMLSWCRMTGPTS